jgi:hypothetical protein
VALNNPILWQDVPPPTAALLPSTALKKEVLGAGRFISPGAAAIGARLRPPRGGGGPAPVGTEVTTSFSQAVSVATGHILHYKVLFKADGYSLGDLLYSLPLAPGQKKEIVVFDAMHTLAGAEAQSLSQNERLAMGLVTSGTSRASWRAA